MAWYHFHKNKQNQTAAKKDSKPLMLNIRDKHDPFGSVSIEQIKAALEAEDFAQLQSLFFVMMRDLKIASAVLTRQQQLVGVPFVVTSENAEFINWLNDKANGIKLNHLIKNTASAIYYGVSLTDVHYHVHNLKLVPTFNLISPRFIHAEVGDQLKTTQSHLYLKQGDKKQFIDGFDKDKVVFHKHAIDIGEITDFSLASKLVWYFSLKHIALAHNLQYFDSVATPPLIAKTSGEEDDVVNALYDLKSACVGVFGQDDVIEYLQVDSQADFLGFIEYIDRQIAMLVLGNTLSTGEGKNGSRSQSEVHEGRQKEVLRYDAGLIAETIESYLNQLEALNFSNPKGVSFTFEIKEKKDLKNLSEVVKNLSSAGFKLDSKDLQAQFGLKIEPKKPSEPTKSSAIEAQALSKIEPAWQRLHQSSAAQQACACQSERNARNVTTDPLESQPPSTQVVEHTLVAELIQQIKHANSVEEVYQRLLEQYPNAPLEALESTLFKAIANSQVLAEAEVQLEQAQ